MLQNKSVDPKSVLIIGAGPNGLAAAAFLRAAGGHVSIHGVPMESWKELMPDRMILRSSKLSSSIASPGDAYSIYEFERQTGTPVNEQPTIGQFIAYGEWFQKQAVPGANPSKVTNLRREASREASREAGSGFTATFEDGSMERVKSVVLATGITPFPFMPEMFAAVSPRLVSHTSGYGSFEKFKNKKVIVIGRGQSALESAALLHEAGAIVEIVTRSKVLHFIKKGNRRGVLGRILSMPRVHEFLYPPTDLAGPPHNWAIADPVTYRQLPKSEKAYTFVLIGPMGSTDLERRLEGVPVTTRVEVVEARDQGETVCLKFSNGTDREVDHVFLATGFRPDINQVEFLDSGLRSTLAQKEGYPLLTLGYESTNIKGFYVLGALSTRSQGPINRFVCGTYPVGQYLTEAITGSRIGYPTGLASRFVAGRRLAYRMYQMSGIKVRR